MLCIQGTGEDAEGLIVEAENEFFLEGKWEWDASLCVGKEWKGNSPSFREGQEVSFKRKTIIESRCLPPGEPHIFQAIWMVSGLWKPWPLRN